MLGAVFPRPADPAFVRELFGQFRGLVRTGKDGPHPDGVGIVTSTRGKVEYQLRTPFAADDPRSEFAAAVERLATARPTGPVLAHVRAASAGRIAVENTHPFVRDIVEAEPPRARGTPAASRGRWAFCHNGTVYGDIPAPPGFVCAGDTDSERLFLHLLARLRTGEAPEHAIEHGVRDFVVGRTYSSTTLLMTDGETLYAYRDATKEPEYYTLFTARGAGGSTFVTQEPLPGLTDLREVPNGGLVIVSADGSIRSV